MSLSKYRVCAWGWKPKTINFPINENSQDQNERSNTLKLSYKISAKKYTRNAERRNKLSE